MPKKDLFTTNILKVTYRDSYVDVLSLPSSEAWHRFRILSDHFANNPFCGIRSISICDLRDNPILTIQNYMYHE